MDLTCINVIIDKNKIKKQDYKILENALKYNIQRIDNDSNRKWNYLIITDKGRIAPMRKTTRAIRAYNPIFVHLYYKCCIKKNDLPNRVGNLIGKKFIGSVMTTLKSQIHLI